MSAIVLTAYDGAILGPIAKVLGIIMNWIYEFNYNVFGIENVVLAITILTIVIYMLMLPLTYQQQKFSKLNAAMQPEIKAIQNKYQDKKDQNSQQLMNQEMQLVYKKYGVSPTGSCVQLIIQMPILFALYRVFYNIPGYIEGVKTYYDALADKVIATSGYETILAQLMTDNKLTTGSGLTYTNVADKLAAADATALHNYVVDILYKLPTSVWETLSASFPDAADTISETWGHIQHFNYFLGLNISDTPWNIMKVNFTAHNYLPVFIALLIPVCSYISQIVSMKLSMAVNGQNNNNTSGDAMSQQMKTMNTMMPLMSLFICFTVPVGLGIYWVLSAVVRVLQMIAINQHMKSLNLDEVIKANQEKAKKELEKEGIRENQIREAARMKTRNYESRKNVSTSSENEEKVQAATAKKANAKKGSMAAKANMVQNFSDQNSRK